MNIDQAKQLTAFQLAVILLLERAVKALETIARDDQ